jgi:hypothetical protein
MYWDLESRNASGIYAVKPMKDLPLGRPRKRWGNKIKRIVSEIDCNIDV